MTVAQMALNIMQTKSGMGQHQEPVSMSSPTALLGVVKALYYTELSQLLFLVSTTLAKVSLCLFLLRLVGRARRYTWLLYAVATVTCGLNLALLLVLAVKAKILRPGSFAAKAADMAVWQPFLDDRCFPAAVASIPLTYAQGLWAAVSDLLLAAFPLAILRGLHMDRRTKASLAAVMGLGVFTAAASATRTAALRVLEQCADLNYAYITLAIWAMCVVYRRLLLAPFPS